MKIIRCENLSSILLRAFRTDFKQQFSPKFWSTSVKANQNTNILNKVSLICKQMDEIIITKYVLQNGYRLGDLPHFNPDLEPIEPPSVTDLRSQIAWSDGLIISSPEYAHGIPGVIKNALDWLVSGQSLSASRSHYLWKNTDQVLKKSAQQNAALNCLRFHSFFAALVTLELIAIN